MVYFIDCIRSINWTAIIFSTGDVDELLNLLWKTNEPASKLLLRKINQK